MWVILLAPAVVVTDKLQAADCDLLLGFSNVLVSVVSVACHCDTCTEVTAAQW